MALIKASSGGAFVKMNTFLNAAAVLFEPKGVDLQVPNTKFGGLQDIIHTDITVFDKEALDGSALPLIVKEALNTETAIVKYLKDKIGDQVVAVLKLKPSKFGNDFVFTSEPDDAVYEKVAAYLTERDAKVETAMASAGPSFMDDDE